MLTGHEKAFLRSFDKTLRLFCIGHANQLQFARGRIMRRHRDASEGLTQFKSPADTSG